MKFKIYLVISLLLMGYYFVGRISAEARIIDIKEQGSWKSLGSLGTGDIGPGALAVSGSGVLHIAYTDDGRDGKASVSKYENSRWTPLGKSGFSLGIADSISLAFDGDTPITSYRDAAARGRAFAAILKDGQWKLEAVSAGEAYNPSLALGKEGEAFMSYRDEASRGKALVMQRNAEGWTNIGAFGNTFNTFLTFDRGGSLYMAYEDYDDRGKASVVRYDKGVWQALSSSRSGRAYDPRLAFGSKGSVYAAFHDADAGGGVSAAKHRGGRWRLIGKAGFLGSKGDYKISLITVEDQPHIACIDTNSASVCVVRFNGASWESLGGALPSPAEDSALSLAYGGSLYLAYRTAQNTVEVFQWE